VRSVAPAVDTRCMTDTTHAGCGETGRMLVSAPRLPGEEGARLWRPMIFFLLSGTGPDKRRKITWLTRRRFSNAVGALLSAKGTRVLAAPLLIGSVPCGCRGRQMVPPLRGMGEPFTRQAHMPCGVLSRVGVAEGGNPIPRGRVLFCGLWFWRPMLFRFEAAILFLLLSGLPIETAALSCRSMALSAS
jgi:hypothetical protein